MTFPDKNTNLAGIQRVQPNRLLAPLPSHLLQLPYESVYASNSRTSLYRILNEAQQLSRWPFESNTQSQSLHQRFPIAGDAAAGDSNSNASLDTEADKKRRHSPTESTASIARSL